MNTPEDNDDSYIDEEPTLVERWRCRCGDMPGHCPGPMNCPMCEEDEKDIDEELILTAEAVLGESDGYQAP